ncbi:4Fe-4S binding protein [Intrasporangium calvum]|uniref:4Fe-4S ferredoxin iron-sulfur binding domain protein n=1 Tax=Intrasporangium calvum (strain ATCC 23552 / DSM 43043 / JCM 3097 / NBRC 12989 / NCIMB 10167 / NRRL B-3866 / 7 KIP) TaxID=710696 RepID=E6SD24_INTC7|nr:4Fe-4S binding protein [Intrasporangium calvum]ADU48612.1 4Fe-4S ferredoxin iron-sulfur binding domain protein [Intrasporangium calvum DSM 43043]AXG13618.1 4Fe-4S binding protein [Intrasporangium calvum]
MSAPTQTRPSAEESPKPNVAPPRRGRNLMEVPLVARAMRSRLYPGVLQVLVAAVFALVAYQLLVGPDTAHDNAGTALMWVLWWPVIPIVFVVLGRFWCAVCPFGWLSDQVQKLVGVNRPVPTFLKRYGIWIIDAQFILITWADHVWGIVESPWGSGVLLLLLTTAVIVSGAFFQRRTFCRYLCFLGGLSGNYARTGMVELRANQDICRTCTSRAACYNGTDKVAGCPLFTFPRTMDSSANCNLCANCIKACPNDALELRLRKPTSELWFIRTPRLEESFLAMAIMGIVIIQNLTMLNVWSTFLDWIGTSTGITSPSAIFTVAFTIAVGAPVGLLVLASQVASRGNLESTKLNFARFGYALIPLDVAGHIAHNLFHLLAEGKSVLFTVVALFGGDAGDGSAALLDTGTIQILQYVVLALGLAGSVYAARRIARGRYRTAARRRVTLVPMISLIVLLAGLNVWMFALPMAHRM